MKASDIQQIILKETGIKTSVQAPKKGSMKGYVIIRPRLMNGEVVRFPFEFVRKLKGELSQYDSARNPVFSNCQDISIYGIEK